VVERIITAQTYPADTIGVKPSGLHSDALNSKRSGRKTTGLLYRQDTRRMRVDLEEADEGSDDPGNPTG
jgi:hypothetical protein